jgi:alanine dehydrogenase
MVSFGILKEATPRECRVALTPAGVQSLVALGSPVYIEKDAGWGSRFSNEEYQAVGAGIVYGSDEIYGRAQVVLKISPPAEEDCRQLTDSQTLFSFLHLAVAKPRVVEILLDKNVTSIGYELIEDELRNLPILQVMGEIAGQMSTQIAARYLESTQEGRGIVLGGIAGVPPATVVIIGAGTVGQAAARMALGAGAEVIVLDKDLRRLRNIENLFGRRVGTAVTNDYNLTKALQFADVVVGAVLIKGERAPHVVSEAMVRRMKVGSIIIDISIDQGGCVETSRPTTLGDPVYVLHNVIHYCVPNIPASVGRTATYGLTNALLPYMAEVAEKGIHRALGENAGLARGLCTYRGSFANQAVARRFMTDPIKTLTREALKGVSGCNG